MVDKLKTEPNIFIRFLIIFSITLVISILAWRFSLPLLLFSEDFENAERNQKYIDCPAFTVVEGRLRVTVAHSYTGCLVPLPNEYREFKMIVSVYSVDYTYDGSINILFAQNQSHGYEIQYRPNIQQIRVIETGFIDYTEKNAEFLGDWIALPDTKFFNEDENKIQLIVTRQSFEFWVNDNVALSWSADNTNNLDLLKGIISIGAGAGEIGGISFEFDNINIYEERLDSK